MGATRCVSNLTRTWKWLARGVMEEIFKQVVAGAIAGTRTGRGGWGDAA